MRLTNRYILENYRDLEAYYMLSEFRGAFAYNVASQNNNGTFIVDKPLEAFVKYIIKYFDNPKFPQKFSYEQISKLITEEVFCNIPEIMELNKMKPDFIDLGALAREIFYMIIRERITDLDEVLK